MENSPDLINHSSTGINKAYAEAELTKKLSDKPSGSITIPIVPDDATLEHLDDEIEQNQKDLLACKDEQIKQLTEIREIQAKMIQLLEDRIAFLEEGLHRAGFTGGRMD